ncbi:MAG: hypothetical protein K8R19_02130 [Methanosarcinales archaeon]|nr:hypothetical protein [Methanosarcinales archaeon]
MNNRSMCSRLGYLLERFGTDADVLLNNASREYVKLDFARPKSRVLGSEVEGERKPGRPGTAGMEGNIGCSQESRLKNLPITTGCRYSPRRENISKPHT